MKVDGHWVLGDKRLPCCEPQREPREDWSCLRQGSPTWEPQTLTAPWPVRNGASQQEVSGR